MKRIKRLPDTELEVMQAIWNCDVPVERKEIEKILYETHPMAMTTLLTMLTRLSEKGFLFIEKQGRHSVYTPLISKEDYLAIQGKAFVDQLCGGKISTFASALCNSGLSKEDIEELRELLKQGTL